MSDEQLKTLTGAGLTLERLVCAMLEFQWQRECEIIPEWVPSHKPRGFEPITVIHYPPTGTFLRYSKGPAQGYFWDIYGDDFLRPEVALRALQQAPHPRIPFARHCGE